MRARILLHAMRHDGSSSSLVADSGGAERPGRPARLGSQPL